MIGRITTLILASKDESLSLKITSI